MKTYFQGSTNQKLQTQRNQKKPCQLYGTFSVPYVFLFEPMAHVICSAFVWQPALQNMFEGIIWHVYTDKYTCNIATYIDTFLRIGQTPTSIQQENSLHGSRLINTSETQTYQSLNFFQSLTKPTHPALPWLPSFSWISPSCHMTSPCGMTSDAVWMDVIIWCWNETVSIQKWTLHHAIALVLLLWIYIYILLTYIHIQIKNTWIIHAAVRTSVTETHWKLPSHNSHGWWNAACQRPARPPDTCLSRRHGPPSSPFVFFLCPNDNKQQEIVSLQTSCRYACSPSQGCRLLLSNLHWHQ